MSTTSNSWRQLLPSFSEYRNLKQTWRSDLVAGITVGIIALPLALAFGVSSGVGAEAGLITAIVAGLIAALFGGSNVQVSGPTGAMVVVLAPIVTAHGVASVFVVSVMAGAIVALAGLLRLGRTVNYIPWPVIEGFTAGIGIIIFLQQVPAAFAVSATEHSNNAGISAGQAFVSASWPKALWPLATVVLTAAIMIVLGRLNKRLPASFLAIVIVTVLSVSFDFPLSKIGELPNSLPMPTMPVFDVALLSELLAPAFAVAALASIESLLSARVAASMADTGVVHADRELLGQGLASIASGFFGGMPATGAIARTAVNVRSGGRTRLAAIIHALTLLAVVYLAAQVVSQIPLAALAGVLMVTASKMIQLPVLKQVLRSTRSDAAVFILTAVITVSFDLIFAVGIGIAAASFFALRTLSRTSGVHREELSAPALTGDERIALFRIDGSLFFGAAERVLERISALKGVEVVILRLSQLQFIDATGAHTLTDLVQTLEHQGITVLIKGVQPHHEKVLKQLDVIAALSRPGHLFKDLAPAIAHARAHINGDYTRPALGI